MTRIRVVAILLTLPQLACSSGSDDTSATGASSAGGASAAGASGAGGSAAGAGGPADAGGAGGSGSAGGGGACGEPYGDGTCPGEPACCPARGTHFLWDVMAGCKQPLPDHAGTVFCFATNDAPGTLCVGDATESCVSRQTPDGLEVALLGDTYVDPSGAWQSCNFNTYLSAPFCF